MGLKNFDLFLHMRAEKINFVPNAKKKYDNFVILNEKKNPSNGVMLYFSTGPCID